MSKLEKLLVFIVILSAPIFSYSMSCNKSLEEESENTFLTEEIGSLNPQIDPKLKVLKESQSPLVAKRPGHDFEYLALLNSLMKLKFSALEESGDSRFEEVIGDFYMGSRVATKSEFIEVTVAILKSVTKRINSSTRWWESAKNRARIIIDSPDNILITVERDTISRQQMIDLLEAIYLTSVRYQEFSTEENDIIESAIIEVYEAHKLYTNQRLSVDKNIFENARATLELESISSNFNSFQPLRGRRYGANNGQASYLEHYYGIQFRNSHAVRSQPLLLPERLGNEVKLIEGHHN